MGSSFSRKSSSSASKTPKPTYRRASAAGKGQASARPTSSVSPKTPRPRTAPAKAVSRPAAKPRAMAKAVPAAKAAPKPLRPVGEKTVAGIKGAGKVAAKPIAKSSLKQAAPAVKIPASKLPKAASPKTGAVAGPKKAVSAAMASAASAAGGLAGRIPRPKINPGKALIVIGVVFALFLAGFILANSPLFAATDIQVKGSDHVEVETARALIEVPEGTTMFNVDEKAIYDSLKAIPWVKGVDVKREWPHTLVVTPVERKMRAIAFITADEVAWAIGEDGTWIAPLSLVVAVDAEGNEVALNDDGSVPEGAAQLPAFEAALRIAQDSGSLLLTDVPSDISPKGGEPVNAKVVLAGLDYANGFSDEFVAQIKDISVASVEAISANLVSGVEVSLGKPQNIVEKERVVTKLLAEHQGVTYINVREPGAYTFRSTPL
ncbi:cell division protein FtsQ/DivIB [Collinsella intestinalis]|uniref:cell division protein FtsQ/DivIB n=1 Tax=Collinsella intestinalis TaxID=147207 RepID=UPI0022E5904D|nr:FtsQ-type POTRA domain-containing protein [Collinsella intestinalis]